MIYIYQDIWVDMGYIYIWVKHCKTWVKLGYPHELETLMRFLMVSDIGPETSGVLGLEISARFGGIGGDPARLRLADLLSDFASNCRLKSNQNCHKVALR